LQPSTFGSYFFRHRHDQVDRHRRTHIRVKLAEVQADAFYQTVLLFRNQDIAALAPDYKF
jgi:hypothetical protein